MDDIRSFDSLFIYVTHEHKDHLDMDFLSAINHRNAQLLFPKYRSDIMRDTFSELKNMSQKEIKELDRYDFEEFALRIFVDDTELTRDSAIAIESNDSVFLNINDCKVHDRINEIKSYYPKINTFAAQFSGATWHPVCYDMPDYVKNKISEKKKLGKFKQIMETIIQVSPESYIPSAGPPVF